MPLSIKNHGLSRSSPPSLLFVFGTLKRGFPLNERGLGNAPFLGQAKTTERYPMVVAGPWFAPMMLTEPGGGHFVSGELYEVDAARLARIDELESIGQPGNWRLPIGVRAHRDGDIVNAFAYLKDRFLAEPIHSGLLDQYEDTRFIPPERRTAVRGGYSVKKP